MKFRNLHPWDLTPREAIQVQKKLAQRISLQNSFTKIHTIAGADIAVDIESNEGIAGVVVYRFPDLKTVERQSARKKLTYPYIPGLLSFREVPVLLEALREIKTEPDLILFDGQGIAHPRFLGIASHMGLLLDKPTIGCAKSLLVGSFEEPAKKAGSTSPLKIGEKTVGMVLRTRDGARPIFVSPGHKIDLETSVQIVKNCCDGFRIPKPTREADRFVGEMKRKHSPAV